MEDVKKGIKDQLIKMETGMEKGDFSNLTDFYTDDCKVLLDGTEILVGKEGLKVFQYVLSQMSDKVGKVDHDILDIFSLGDTATSVSTGTIYGNDGSVMHTTKAIAIWKKENGTWRVHCWCGNNDKPTPIG